MVKLLIPFLLFCFVSVCSAITPDELRLLSGKGATEKRRVDQQLNLKDLRYELQTQKKATIMETGKQVSTESETAGAGQGNDKKDILKVQSVSDQQRTSANSPPQSEKYQQSRVEQEHPQDIRTRERRERFEEEKQRTERSPQKKSGKTPHFVDAVMPSNKRYYGIRRGAWLNGEILRDVNSSEPGDVEIYITREIHGDKRTLPVGTVIFANKAFNSATNRLDFLVTYAIAPNGREFELRARVYDSQKVSGLDGIIDADEGKIVSQGVTAGMSAFGTSLLGEVSGNNPVGNALSSSGKSVIGNASRAAEVGTDNQITIYVAPQQLLLRVESTF